MSNARITPLGLTAALAWLLVPVLWGIATVVDRTQVWEDSPQTLWMLGWFALMGAGVVTLLLVMRHTGGEPRRGLIRAGYVVYGLGVAITVVAGWAIQAWMLFFGVGLLLFAAASSSIRLPARAIGAGMLLALGVQIVLTLAKVGTPDVYGDYPVAWTTATIIAAAVAAGGSLRLGRRAAVDRDLVPVG